jgi:hypothetical protein
VSAAAAALVLRNRYLVASCIIGSSRQHQLASHTLPRKTFSACADGPTSSPPRHALTSGWSNLGKQGRTDFGKRLRGKPKIFDEAMELPAQIPSLDAVKADIRGQIAAAQQMPVKRNWLICDFQR